MGSSTRTDACYHRCVRREGWLDSPTWSSLSEVRLPLQYRKGRRGAGRIAVQIHSAAPTQCSAKGRRDVMTRGVLAGVASIALVVGVDLSQGVLGQSPAGEGSKKQAGG